MIRIRDTDVFFEFEDCEEVERVAAAHGFSVVWEQQRRAWVRAWSSAETWAAPLRPIATQGADTGSIMARPMQGSSS